MIFEADPDNMGYVMQEGMRKSRLSTQKQVQLLEHFVAGPTARCAADLVSVNTKTATYCYHRLRQIISDQLVSESSQYFSSKIEIDQSLIRRWAQR